MPAHGSPEHEDVQAWRTLAAGEVDRLRSLTGAQLAAEVLRRGFAGLPPGGERTRIGLSNSLCPVAPSMLGGDDIEMIQQHSELLGPVLSALQDAGLLRSETRGRSALPFYTLTSRGRSALEDDDVDAILSMRAQG